MKDWQDNKVVLFKSDGIMSFQSNLFYPHPHPS